MGCPWGGEQIKFEPPTEWQKKLEPILYSVITGGLKGSGATAYPGQMSAQINAPLIAALNLMMGMGGYGGYKVPTLPSTPYNITDPRFEIPEIENPNKFIPVDPFDPNLRRRPFDPYDPYSYK